MLLALLGPLESSILRLPGYIRLVNYVDKFVVFSLQVHRMHLYAGKAVRGHQWLGYHGILAWHTVTSCHKSILVAESE